MYKRERERERERESERAKENDVPIAAPDGRKVAKFFVLVSARPILVFFFFLFFLSFFFFFFLFFFFFFFGKQKTKLNLCSPSFMVAVGACSLDVGRFFFLRCACCALILTLPFRFHVAAIQLELGQLATGAKQLDFNAELRTVGLSNFISGITGGFTGSYIFSQVHAE